MARINDFWRALKRISRKIFMDHRSAEAIEHALRQRKAEDKKKTDFAWTMKGWM